MLVSFDRSSVANRGSLISTLQLVRLYYHKTRQDQLWLHHTAIPDPMSTQTPTQPEAPAVRELSEKQLDGLMQRIREACDYNLALSSDDYDVLMNAVLMLANMQERLSNNDLTMSKLKKLPGIINSSEKLDKLRPGANGKNQSVKPSRSKGTHGRKGSRKPRSRTPSVKRTVHRHAVEDLNKGDSCPSCALGRVYKYNPSTLLRISAHSPFSREQHIIKQLRCNGCGEIFSAQLPPAVKADGRADQQYGYSAIAMMGIQGYYGDSPLYR